MLRANRRNEAEEPLISQDPTADQTTGVKNESSGPKRSMFPFFLWRLTSSWGERFWPFILGMFLITLPEFRSLGFVALQLAACSVAQLALGSMLSKWTMNKSTSFCEAVFVPLVVQKASIAVSSAIFLTQTSSVAMALAGILFAVIAHLANSTYQSAINKKWLPAYTEQRSLSKTSATVFKYIDWMSALLAPLGIGAIMKWYGAGVTALFVIIWQMTSACVEIAMLYHVYAANKDVFPDDGQRQSSQDGEEIDVSISSSKRSNFWQSSMLFEPLQVMSNSWRRFGQSELSWLTFAMAALYFTFMCLDPITTGYLRLYCVDELTAASVRSAGWAVGLLGVGSFPLFRSVIGLRRLNLLGYLTHVALVTLIFASFALPGLNSVTLDDLDFCSTKVRFNDSVINHSSHLLWFVIAAVASRFTLWISDSAINAAFDDHLPSSEKPYFDNVSPALNAVVDLCRLSLVMLMPYPSQFGMLVLAALSTMACGWTFLWLGCPADLVTNLAKKFSPAKKNRK